MLGIGSPATVHPPTVPVDWVTVCTLVAPAAIVTVTPAAGWLPGSVVTEPDSEPDDRATVSWTPVSFWPSVSVSVEVCEVKPGELAVTV